MRPWVGFSAEDAGVGRRPAHRDRQVAAEADRRHPGGDRRRLAAARATRRALEVPWVVRSPRAGGFRSRRRVGKLREVGLREQDPAGALSSAPPRSTSVFGDAAGEDRRPPLAEDPGGVERVLDGERHAVQWPDLASRGEFLRRPAWQPRWASSLTVTIALIFLSSVASMRSRCAWTTSTEETLRSRISSARAVASE